MPAMRLPRGAVETTITACGLALIAGALAAGQFWLDRHFLPSFLLPRVWYVRIEASVRVALAVLGLLLIAGARPLASRLTRRTLWRALQIASAVALALAAGEAVLRRIRLGPAEWRDSGEEPLRRPDSRLGWTFVPARTTLATTGGRTIEYVFDRAGYRVRQADKPVDPEQPSILFAGESVMFGDGLTYDESVPGQVEGMLKTPGVNLAVYGYSTDQIYLKLQADLPRFAHPVAVVALFVPALFGRNLDDDRPRLGPGLVWQPARTHAKIFSLALLLVPFRREKTVENGIAMTREVLTATVSLIRSRGAMPLIAVPQIGREEEPERVLRQRILDEGRLPYVFIELDSAWRLPWNRHPDARAAREIAVAIAERLRAGGLAAVRRPAATAFLLECRPVCSTLRRGPNGGSTP
jgi:hypothetical protein